MKDFTFYNPTRIEFGEDKENRIGQILKEYRIESILILHGSDRIKKSGLFDRLIESLNENKISYKSLGGVISNPVISHARKAIEIAKENKLQAVLAVGGGSVLDSAKAIAAGARYSGDVWDFFIGKAFVKEALPVFSILTLAATGSEMNPNGVLTNEETKEKFPIVSPLLFPKVSIMNPKLMSTVSDKYLAYSAVDIFSHCLDLYFSASYLPEFTAELIENILKTVVRTTNILLKDAKAYDARGEFAWAATMALNGNTFAGVAGNSFDTHMIEHAMSALYNIPHGAGLSIVLPAWMESIKDEKTERFKRFAEKVFETEDIDEGIKRMKGWFSEIGAPVSFNEADLGEDTVKPIVESAFVNAKLWGMDKLYPQERIESILKKAL